MPTIPFQQLYPRATPLAIDLLEKLLNFDPAARITVEQALAHPYLAAYHEEDDEPVHDSVFDFSFESTDRIEEMKSTFLLGRKTTSPPPLQDLGFSDNSWLYLCFSLFSISFFFFFRADSRRGLVVQGKQEPGTIGRTEQWTSSHG